MTVRPDAIIFDWDNTLVDTFPVIHEALNNTFKAFGKPLWSYQETKDRVRQSMRDRFPALFGDAWEDAAKTFYDCYSAVHIEKLTPCDGAEDMLKTIQQMGLFMAVVSNKTGHYLRVEANHLGWDKYFTNIVGAGDADQDKPAIDPVVMALSKYQGWTVKSDPTPVHNSSIWFVGDADIDLECAANAGLVPVLLRNDPPGSQEFDPNPPNHHFKNALELCKFLGTL